MEGKTMNRFICHRMRQVKSKATNKAFIDIRLRPSSTTPLAPYGPLRPNVTSSIKSGVHNVSQRHQRRTEPRPRAICIINFVKIGPAVPEICSRTDSYTHTQTDWSQYPAPLLGRSNKMIRMFDIVRSESIITYTVCIVIMYKQLTTPNAVPLITVCSAPPTKSDMEEVWSTIHNVNSLLA